MKNPIPQNWKLFWSVFSISCLLGGLTLALCMFLLPHRDEAERTAAIVLCALYAFFLLPDLIKLFVAALLAVRLEKHIR